MTETTIPTDDLADGIDHIPDNMAEHFQGAYRKGAEAFRDGADRTDNPYVRKRNSSMFGTSWGHVWYNAWQLGWENEKRVQNGEKPRDYHPRGKVR